MRPRDASCEERTRVVLETLRSSSDHDYIGEDVSQLEHAVQCAWHAHNAGADTVDVLAALMHDVGHWIQPGAPQMEGLGVVAHEQLGADWIRDMGFSEDVATLVAGHVAAKRYLCFEKPAYWNNLSEASRGTLAWQGGPMNAQEAADFKASPLFKRILALRTWDERAKDPDAKVPGLDEYESVILAHLEDQRRLRGS